MRLQTKMILLIAAIAVATVLVSAFFVGRPMLQDLDDDLRKEGAILARTVAGLITNNVINREVLPTREAINDILEKTEDVEYIYVVGFDGAVFAHTFKDGFPRDFTTMLDEVAGDDAPQFRRFQTERGPVLDVGQSLISGMRARINVGINQGHQYAIISGVRKRIIGTTFFIVLPAIVVGVILSRRITRPLDGLARSMKAFGEGNVDAGISVSSGGLEVKQLADSFNRMIADRRRSETELRETEQRFRELFDRAADALFLHDMEGRIVDANKLACESLGYTYREILDLSVSDVVLNSDMEALKKTWKGLAPGAPLTLEGAHRRKDGTTFPVEVRVGLFEWGGHPLVLALARDMSERRKMEEELLRAEKLESLGILAGGLAHDFNNLLTAILGNVSLAKLSAAENVKTRERLEEAEKASLRARDLTQQLLTFSKGGSPVKKAVSLKELLRDSSCFALRGADVRCEVSIPDGLWSVEADEGQISQVINNLVINADQAMPDGGTIRMRCENTVIAPGHSLPLQPGNYVAISVRDEGVGIPGEHLEKIFEPFFTTKPKGSGLGLATSYSIVKNHGGIITVESEQGKGATFHVYLPASDKALIAAEANDEGPVGGKGRILLMDDEKMILEVGQAVLARLGYDVECAVDGHDALVKYGEAKRSGRPFDAVIMDLTIPGGMGGKDAVRKLLEADPAAKVIVSSGYSTDPIMADFRSYGFSGVVTKPYRIQTLSKTVHDVLAGSGS
jgi:PAS domain S-box-containing protein